MSYLKYLKVIAKLLFLKYPEPSELDFEEARCIILPPGITEEDYRDIGLDNNIYIKVKSLVLAEAKHIVLMRHLNEILND